MCAVMARQKAYPLKMGDFYDTKYSKMIENGVDLPTIIWDKWPGQIM